MDNKNVITRNNFISYVASLFRNTPKYPTCLVKDMFNADEPEIRGESVVANKAGDIHELYVHECLFEDFNYLLAIISHEAAHASVHEMLNTLHAAGMITEELFELMSEKTASLCEEMVFQILTHREELEQLFEKIEDKKIISEIT